MESDQPLIAGVNEGRNVTAERVGETYIKANNETCKVTGCIYLIEIQILIPLRIQTKLNR